MAVLPDRQTIDDEASAALRRLAPDYDHSYVRSHTKSPRSFVVDNYEQRDDDSARHVGSSSHRRHRRHRSSSRDERRRARKEERRPEHKREKKSRRKRFSRRRDDDDDEDDDDGILEKDEGHNYHQYEETDDQDYGYTRMQNQPPQQAAVGTDHEDPFGLNLCQGSETFSDGDLVPPSETRRSRRVQRLANTSLETSNTDWTEEQYYKPRQDHSYASITITALQLLVLMLQLAMCGVAPLEVNPMVGPFPDAFSEWGGKNAYLILENQEYWRLITPAFLHVGVLHLLANAFCLLYSSALFEREWGSWTWLFIFFISEVGCVAVSCVSDPDTVAVGSSGALMGLFSAKLAHVLTYTFFDTKDMASAGDIQLGQLSSVLCGLTLVSLLSSFTYVDWSGHMGGLATGFFTGMLIFARPIKSCCYGLMWGFLGLCGLAGMFAGVAYLFLNETEPYEELADVCEYFRHLFPEGYECGCLFQ